jgi:TRAP-type uncharacterized transport system fused permease subunit
MDWLLFGIFIFLMLAGVPLAVAMGLAGTAVVAISGLGMLSLPTNGYTGITKYPLMAIPVFVIAGLIFERVGVAAGIVRFASALVGERRGSLAIVAILVAMIMGGISGSGPADSAAVGAVMLPSMIKAGYPRAFTASVIGAAGSTGILIPPSIAFVIYSLLVPQASVPALFAAGIIPGILAGISLILMAWWLSVRHGFEAEPAEARPPFWQSLKEAGWGLLAPVIILGGMRSGVFTPTEAAVVAVFLWALRRHGRLSHADLARGLQRPGRGGRDFLGDHDHRRAGQRLRLGEQYTEHFRPSGQGRARHGFVGNRHVAVDPGLVTGRRHVPRCHFDLLHLPAVAGADRHAFQLGSGLVRCHHHDEHGGRAVHSADGREPDGDQPDGRHLDGVGCRLGVVMVAAMGTTMLRVTFVPELALWLPRHLGYL